MIPGFNFSSVAHEDYAEEENRKTFKKHLLIGRFAYYQFNLAVLSTP